MVSHPDPCRCITWAWIGLKINYLNREQVSSLRASKTIPPCGLTHGHNVGLDIWLRTFCSRHRRVRWTTLVSTHQCGPDVQSDPSTMPWVFHPYMFTPAVLEKVVIRGIPSLIGYRCHLSDHQGAHGQDLCNVDGQDLCNKDQKTQPMGRVGPMLPQTPLGGTHQRSSVSHHCSSTTMSLASANQTGKLVGPSPLEMDLQVVAARTRISNGCSPSRSIRNVSPQTQ